MNPYFNLAEAFIEKEVGKDFGIVQSSVQDLSDFYAFTYHTKKYLQTGDFDSMTVGQGYNFINKVDNRVFSYGSRYAFEQALEVIRKKISQEATIKKTKPEFDLKKRFDLKICKVLKKQILVDTLLKFKLTYILPEIVGDSIFRVAANYNKKLFFDKLTNLPLTFHSIDQFELPELLIELEKNYSCEFEIIEHAEKNFAKYIANASAIDLEPIW